MPSQSIPFRKSHRASSTTDDESWVKAEMANTLNRFDTGERDTHAIAFTQNQREEVRELGPVTGALSGQGTHQTTYIAATIDMQACKGNANIGDGSFSPTLCKPSGSDVHAVAFPIDTHNMFEHHSSGGIGFGQRDDPSFTITKHKSHAVAHTLRAEGHDASEDCTGRSVPMTVAFHPTQDPFSSTDGTTHAMGCGSKQGTATVAVATQMVVRRLTPVECERLQGFPDGYTNIPWRGKTESPDGPRYKALGNSMAVNCMRWIGRRIDAVEKGTELPA